MTGNEIFETIRVGTPELEKTDNYPLYLRPESSQLHTESTTLPALMATKVGIAVTWLGRESV
jgi:hypothetical protein